MPCRANSAMCITGLLHLTNDTKELMIYSTLACQLKQSAAIQPDLLSFVLPHFLKSNVASTWDHESREHRGSHYERMLGKSTHKAKLYLEPAL